MASACHGQRKLFSRFGGAPVELVGRTGDGSIGVDSACPMAEGGGGFPSRSSSTRLIVVPARIRRAAYEGTCASPGSGVVEERAEPTPTRRSVLSPKVLRRNVTGDAATTSFAHATIATQLPLYVTSPTSLENAAATAPHRPASARWLLIISVHHTRLPTLAANLDSQLRVRPTYPSATRPSIRAAHATQLQNLSLSSSRTSSSRIL